MAEKTAAEKFQFDVVTPTRLLLSEKADMVVIPGGDGDFGVLPGHAPLLSTVRPGSIAIYERDKVRERVFVEGGFAEVTETRCTVLAQMAIPVAEISEDEALKRFDKARAALEAAEDFDARKAQGRELAVAEALLAAVRTRAEDRKRGL